MKGWFGDKTKDGGYLLLWHFIEKQKTASMSDFIFQVRGQTIELEDLGENLNEQFKMFYESYLSDGSFAWGEFEEMSHEFFDQECADHHQCDRYFNNFTVIWRVFLNQEQYRKGARLWNKTLTLVESWEEQNNGRIHKGTPYYFWGITCILNGQIEKGFLLMHGALEEDKKTRNTSNPSTPARHFTLLNPQPQRQAFRQKVDQISNFLQKYLEEYRSTRRRGLVFKEFRSRFLEEIDLQETAFSFVYNLFRLETLVSGMERTVPTENAYTAIHRADLFFSFCRVIENVIRHPYEAAHQNPGAFANHLDYLSSQTGTSLDSNKLGEINQDRQVAFQSTIQRLLTGSYHFKDGSAPSPIEEDIGVAYCFRNFGAHTIDEYPVITQNFENISKRILFTLFLSVEVLY